MMYVHVICKGILTVSNLSSDNGDNGKIVNPIDRDIENCDVPRKIPTLSQMQQSHQSRICQIYHFYEESVKTHKAVLICSVYKVTDLVMFHNHPPILLVTIFSETFERSMYYLELHFY